MLHGHNTFTLPLHSAASGYSGSLPAAAAHQRGHVAAELGGVAAVDRGKQLEAVGGAVAGRDTIDDVGGRADGMVRDNVCGRRGRGR